MAADLTKIFKSPCFDQRQRRLPPRLLRWMERLLCVVGPNLVLYKVFALKTLEALHFLSAALPTPRPLTGNKVNVVGCLIIQSVFGGPRGRPCRPLRQWHGNRRPTPPNLWTLWSCSGTSFQVAAESQDRSQVEAA